MKWEDATITFSRGIGGTTQLYRPNGTEQKFAGTFLEFTRVFNLRGCQG